MAQEIREFLEQLEARVAGQHTLGGKRGMLYEGPSGRGKDVTAEAVLKAHGYKEGFMNINPANPRKTYYRLTTSMDPQQMMEVMTKARLQGSLVLISEPNLLSSAFFEGKLNNDLTGDDVFNPLTGQSQAVDPAFGFIFTSNSTEFSGREKFSSALLNRLTYKKLNDYSQEELTEIVNGRLTNLKKTDVEYLVKAHLYIRDHVSAVQHAPTVRKLLEAAERIQQGQSAEEAVQEIYGPFYLEIAMNGHKLPQRAKLKKYVRDPLDKVEALSKLATLLLPASQGPVKIAVFERQSSDDPAAFFQEDTAGQGNARISIELSLLTHGGWESPFLHEVSHGVFTRINLTNDLEQDLEDIRHELAFRRHFPFSSLGEGRLRDLNQWLDQNPHSGARDVFQHILLLYAHGQINESQIKEIQTQMDSHFEGQPTAKALKYLNHMDELKTCIPENLEEEEILFQQDRARRIYEVMRADYESLPEKQAAPRGKSQENSIDARQVNLNLSRQRWNSNVFHPSTERNRGKEIHRMSNTSTLPSVILNRIPAQPMEAKAVVQAPQQQGFIPWFQMVMQEAKAEIRQEADRYVQEYMDPDQVFGPKGTPDARRFALGMLRTAFKRTGGKITPGQPRDIYFSDWPADNRVNPILASLIDLLKSYGFNIRQLGAEYTESDLKAKYRPQSYEIISLKEFQKVFEEAIAYHALLNKKKIKQQSASTTRLATAKVTLLPPNEMKVIRDLPYTWRAQYSPDGRYILGIKNKDVIIIDATNGGEIRRLTGHALQVQSAVFSSDGSKVLTGSLDRTARIWDTQNGQELQQLTGHTGLVQFVAFSSDGSRVLTGRSGEFRIWDTHSGQELQQLRGHTSLVNSVDFSPDGSRVLIGSSDAIVRIWDARNGQELQQLRGHTSSVSSVAFFPDGSKVLAGSMDGVVRIWDAQNGQELQQLRGHTGLVNSLDFFPDGSKVLTGSMDQTARLWDVNSGAELKQFTGRGVLCAVFSPDGTRVLTSDDSDIAKEWVIGKIQALPPPTVGAVTLLPPAEMKVVQELPDTWRAQYSPDGRYIVGIKGNDVLIKDVASKREVQRLRGHKAKVLSAVFSADGSKILTGSGDKTAWIWDVQSGKILKQFTGHTGSVFSAVFSADGSKVLTGSGDATARLWDVQSGAELKQFKGHINLVMSVIFSPDGSKVLTGSDDNTARIWDVQKGNVIQVLKGHTNSVRSVVFSSDGSKVLTGSDDNTARLWDAQSGRELAQLKGHTNEVSFAVFSPDGTKILTSGRDKVAQEWVIGQIQTPPPSPTVGAVTLLSPDEMKEIRELSNAGRAQYSPDGRRIVGIKANDVILRNVTNGKSIKTFRHKTLVRYVEFSPDGTKIVTTSENKTVHVWDVGTGNELKQFKGHTDELLTVVFSPDGTKILTSSFDATARIWNVQTGKELQKFKGHMGWVSSAVFSPDGSKVLTASEDKTVRIWNAHTGQQIMSTGFREAVNSAVFSSDGARILITINDQLAYILDAQTAQELQEFKGHTGILESAVFSPDGTKVLTASQDQTARIWDTQTGQQIKALTGYTRPILRAVFSPDGTKILATDGLAIAKEWIIGHVQTSALPVSNKDMEEKVWNEFLELLIDPNAIERAQKRIDEAMSTTLPSKQGGIDLTQASDQLQVLENSTIHFKIDAAQLAQLESAEGFQIKTLHISDLPSLLTFLDLNE